MPDGGYKYVCVRYGDIPLSDISFAGCGFHGGGKFLKDLKDSIKEHGIVNPVILATTAKGKALIRYGATRLMYAREFGIDPVKAVIADYHDKYPELERLYTKEDIASKWFKPELILKHIYLSDTKLWFHTHPRVPIDDKGNIF